MLYLWWHNGDWTLTPSLGEPQTPQWIWEWGGSSAEINTGSQAEQEVSNCSIGSFKQIEALGQPTKMCAIDFLLATICAQWRAELTQFHWFNTIFSFFLSDSLLMNLFLCWMLGSSALYYVFTLFLFCFACLLLLLHMCLPLSLYICLAFCYQLILPAPGLFHVRASVAVMFRLGPAWLALHALCKICVRALSGMSNAQYDCNHSSG